MCAPMGFVGGCYDARMAGQFEMSYGKYIALYGHNLGRRVDTAPEKRRRCPVCGGFLPITAWKSRVFCSAACADADAERRRSEAYGKRKGGGGG